MTGAKPSKRHRAAGAGPRRSAGGRARHRDLEQRREAMLARLAGLQKRGGHLPAYGSALTLLNARFRAATLPTRYEILNAVEFMIRVLQEIVDKV